MSAKEINGYELSRKFWDFSFDNPEKVKPAHGAVYFFAIEHNNRLGWREKFGFPTEMAMSAVGIKNWRTYSGVLNDLEKWGFIEFLERSKNQYSANIISLFAYVKNTKATTKALDKAMQKHIQKQGTKQVRSTVVIDKHINLRTIEHIPSELENIISFWNGEDDKKTLVVTRRLKNPSCKIGEKIMMSCLRSTIEIEKIFKKLKKDYSEQDFVYAVTQYGIDITKRADDRDGSNYCGHRFSFRDFLKQANGFMKFVNYSDQL